MEDLKEMAEQLKDLELALLTDRELENVADNVTFMVNEVINKDTAIEYLYNITMEMGLRMEEYNQIKGGGF